MAGVTRAAFPCVSVSLLIVSGKRQKRQGRGSGGFQRVAYPESRVIASEAMVEVM